MVMITCLMECFEIRALSEGIEVLVKGRKKILGAVLWRVDYIGWIKFCYCLFYFLLNL